MSVSKKRAKLYLEPDEDEKSIDLDIGNEEILENENEDINEYCGNQVDESQSDKAELPAQKRPRQKFRAAWKKQLPWLSEISGKAFCKICSRTFNNNIVSLRRHGNSSEHKSKSEGLQNQVYLESTIEEINHKQNLEQVKAAESKIIMFLIEHNLSLTLISPLIELVKNVCTDSEIAKNLNFGKSKTTETTLTCLKEKYIKHVKTILINRNK